MRCYQGSLPSGLHFLPILPSRILERECLPARLKRHRDPSEARIIQVVETWDLMQVDLPYRKEFKRDDVLKYIQSGSGKRFDPRVVEKFISLLNIQS